MVLEVEFLDLLNFDNFVFYVSFVFIIVCVYVIYKKKKIWKVEIEMSLFKFYSNGILILFC